MLAYRLQDHDIWTEGSVLNLTEGIFLEGKVDFDNTTTAEPVEIDGIPGIALTLPAQSRWVRMRANIKPQAGAENLLAMRLILKIEPLTEEMPLSLRATLATSVGERGRCDIFEEMRRDLRVEGPGVYVIGGLLAHSGEARGVLQLVLDLPRRARSRITLLSLDMEWHVADLSEAASDRLANFGGQAVSPFQIAKLPMKASVSELVGSPCVVAGEERFSSFTLNGHAVSVPRSDHIILKTAAQKIECRTENPVELADGVQLACGYEMSLLDIDFDEKNDDLFFATRGKIDLPYRHKTIPSELVRLVKGSGSRDVVEANGALELFFYPDYTGTNPYQNLMYSNMDGTTAKGGTIEEAIARLEQGERAGSVVLHLHWLNPILAGAGTAEEADMKRRRFKGMLRHLVRLGGIVFWTVHNTVSHDAKFAEVETKLGQDVADLAHRIHVHSETLLPILAESYQLPAEKLLIQPHPNYVGAYPDYVTRSAARKRLGLPETAKVILFFGQLRPYKGIENLARAFAETAAAYPDAYLLVVGKPVHPYTPGDLSRKLQIFENVRVIEEFVPDTKLQWYYRATDWVALPYLNILTSGSLLCAMSFSRPCIAPNMGMIGDVLKDGLNGVLYEPDDAKGLTRAVSKALNAGAKELESMKEEALASVYSLTRANLGQALRTAVFDISNAARTVCLDFEDGKRDCQLTGPAFPPAHPSRTAIIILNYEHIDDVHRLVETLEASRDQDFDIYVVDNASPSLTAAELFVAFPRIHLLCLPENLGYAAGNNAAMRLISDVAYEFIWILNPDMVVSPDALEQHVTAAAAHPEHSIFGATILQGGDDRKVASAGCYINMSDGLSTGHMYAGEQIEMLPDQPFEADFITGASVFLRKSVLESIGYMPEDYFLYFEETHWLLNARKDGFPSLVLPNVFLAHYKRSEEGGLPAKYYFYYYIRNALLFYARMENGNVDVLRGKLLSGFIASWMDKIKARRPALVDIYAHLADTAINDGMAGIAGKTDLFAIEYAGEHTDQPPESDPMVNVATFDDGNIKGIVSIFSESLENAHVTILVDGRNVATTMCQPVKSDRIENMQQWSFEATLPEAYCRGASVKVDLLLNGRYMKGASRVVYLSQLPADFIGRIDGISSYVCRGWALNKNDNGERLVVEILYDNAVVARTVADSFRPDLKKNGLGDGYSAFEVRMPKVFTDGNSHELSLRIANTDHILFKRSFVGDKSSGGVKDLQQPADQMMEDLFFERQLWLSEQELEDLPFGRLCEISINFMAAKYASRPETQLVSIIMPAFNRADTILSALESVRAQSYENWELLVVDDGSSDNTVAVLQAYVAQADDSRIRILELAENSGVSAARNFGLQNAQGEIIAYLDTDNTWLPDFLRIMTGELMSQPTPGSAYCGQRIVQVCGTPEVPVEDVIGLRMGAFHLPLLENRNYIDLNCFVHHRRIYDALGGFAEEIRRLVDWEIILRYARIEAPHFVPAPLSNYYFDKAGNQITKLESYDSNLKDFGRLRDQHVRKAVPDVSIRRVDIGLVGDENQSLEDLIQRATEVQDSLSPDAPATFMLCPAPVVAVSQETVLPLSMRLVRADEDTAVAALVRERSEDADLLVMSGYALPQRNWLEHLNAALDNCPEGGMFISRRMISKQKLKLHAKAVPFAHSAFDACVALRADRRRVLDVSFNPAMNIIELSRGDEFFNYIPNECASALQYIFRKQNSEDAQMGLASEMVRVTLKRKIFYCGDVEVYEM